MNTKEDVLESLNIRIALNEKVLAMFAQQLQAGHSPFYALGQNAMQAEVERDAFTSFRTDVMALDYPIEKLAAQIHKRIKERVVNFNRNASPFQTMRDSMQVAAYAQFLEMLTGE